HTPLPRCSRGRLVACTHVCGTRRRRGRGSISRYMAIGRRHLVPRSLGIWCRGRLNRGISCRGYRCLIVLTAACGAVVVTDLGICDRGTSCRGIWCRGFVGGVVDLGTWCRGCEAAVNDVDVGPAVLPFPLDPAALLEPGPPCAEGASGAAGELGRARVADPGPVIAAEVGEPLQRDVGRNRVRVAVRVVQQLPRHRYKRYGSARPVLG